MTMIPSWLMLAFILLENLKATFDTLKSSIFKEKTVIAKSFSNLLAAADSELSQLIYVAVWT